MEKPISRPKKESKRQSSVKAEKTQKDAIYSIFDKVFNSLNVNTPISCTVAPLISNCKVSYVAYMYTLFNAGTRFNKLTGLAYLEHLSKLSGLFNKATTHCLYINIVNVDLYEFLMENAVLYPDASITLPLGYPSNRIQYHLFFDVEKSREKLKTTIKEIILNMLDDGLK